MNGLAQPTPQPDARVNVSLTPDRNAIVVRYLMHLPGSAIHDLSIVLPPDTARAVARAILEQCDKSTQIVVPQISAVKKGS